jgi:hypothetical protein
VVLYDWLETVNVSDVALSGAPFVWDGSSASVDELADLWVQVQELTTSRVTRAEPEWYTLDAGNGKGIEASGSIKVWHEPGSGYGGNPARSWANEPAFIYQLSIPLSNNAQGNPYYQNAAMGKRALVVAIVDLMMYHDLLLDDGFGTWMDMYGKAFVSWAETYRWTKAILPPQVRAAYEQGMGCFLDQMIDVGPRAVNTNMDMFALGGLVHLYMAASSSEIRTKCVQAAKNALFGYPDGEIELKQEVFKLEGVDKGVFDPSGFIMEGDQPDVFYGGESIYHVVAALAAATDRDNKEVVPEWKFLEEVVFRLGQWRHYQMLYEPGVASSSSGGIKAATLYHAGAGFFAW